MSTAAEIQLRMAEAQAPVQAAMRRVQRELVDPLIAGCTHVLFGRVVHSQRARKLRRRGDVVRYRRRTETGRAVYTWMPRLEFML